MSRFIEIGAAPANADCAQVGQTADFDKINRLEVRLYAAAIQARYGAPPTGCTLEPVINRHDFGNYLTLALKVDDFHEDQPAVIGYVEAVADGLGSWLEAGLAPPIRYLADGSATTDGRDFDDLIMGALRTTRPGPDGTWPIAEFAVLHTNLTTIFPTHADAVRQQMEFPL